jgi:fructose-1,6-bisphosphatase/inositol monophosphatase family enzyme
MVEYNLKIWDLAATKALIEGAGGTYLEIGADDSPGKPRAYHAVFGKGRAVNLLVGAISGVPEGCI